MNFFSSEITVGSRKIGPKHPPFIIAEMSGNHNQSLDRALKLVEAAAHAGAHALKIQTYTADTMTIDQNDGEFFISDKDSLWKGESLYNLYKQAHTPWEWHKPIFEHAKKLGMIAFSTPFDDTAVDFLEELNVPCYKVASFENTHLPLIRKMARTGKPLIVSTGMATLSNLQDLIDVLKTEKCHNAILLKCTSTYPAEPIDSNIKTIPHMRELFGCMVGLSDHTMGTGVAVGAVALGAPIVEKHFTLSRSDGGVDSTFSLEPHELEQLVIETKRVWQSLGQVSYSPSQKEKKSLIFRRSIYVIKDIKKGEPFSENNVKIIRPGFGLAPKEIDTVLKSLATTDLKRGTALKHHHLLTETEP